MQKKVYPGDAEGWVTVPHPLERIRAVALAATNGEMKKIEGALLAGEVHRRLNAWDGIKPEETMVALVDQVLFLRREFEEACRISIRKHEPGDDPEWCHGCVILRKADQFLE